MVIKRDGRREPFDRSKLERGIERSLEKRPVSMNEIENIVSDIEDAAIMNSKGAKEIKSTELGEMVLSRLHSLDKVAYIRFASVYKKFNNLDEFINEVQKIHITSKESR
jgi:transcriptional repressor nrdR